MINIKKILKGLRILNENDQSKSLELSVSNSATTNTKTTIVSAQTGNRTITLPDATTSISGNDTPADLTNKTLSLSNTTDNKLLVSEASTHKIVDSTLTHINSSGNTQLSATGDFSLTVPSNKEIVFQGKSLRVPVVTFPVLTPPTGNVGNILFNTTTQSLWFYQTTGYVELISDAGANKTLTNLIAPVAANQNINPDTDGRDLGTSLLRWDVFAKDVNANTVTAVDITATGNSVVDDLTVNGKLTLLGTIDKILQDDLEIEDKQITINKGGTDATSVNAGLIVERTSDEAHLFFDNTLASKFKAGMSGSESEIITASTSQVLTGNKLHNAHLTLSSKLNLTSSVDTSTNSDLNLAGRSPVISLLAPIGSKTPITSISNFTEGQTQLIKNDSGDPVEFVSGASINTGDYTSIIVRPNESVMTFVIGGVLNVLPTVKPQAVANIPNIIKYETAGTFTYIPSSNLSYIKIKMVGGGGGGSSSDTNGTSGGFSRFQDNGSLSLGSIQVNGGDGGSGSPGAGNVYLGGAGGGSSTTGPLTGWQVLHRIGGTSGSNGYANNTFNAVDGVVGNGGSSFFGGGGRAGDRSTSGLSGKANTGSGGGGYPNVTIVNSYTGASGGSSGAYAEFIIPVSSISTSYAVTVGTGGAGAASAGSGGTGVVIIEEYLL